MPLYSLALLFLILLSSACASSPPAPPQSPPEVRLNELQSQLYATHDQILLHYEALDVRYLELELVNKVQGEHRQGLSTMRALYLEMQHHFGAVLESHHDTLEQHQPLAPSNHAQSSHPNHTDLDPLDEARNDYLHYHGLEVLHAHHQRLVSFHRRMISISHASDFQPFIDAHHQLLELHREILRLCDQKMRLLKTDFGVNTEHRHLLEPFELRPAENPPETPTLI